VTRALRPGRFTGALAALLVLFLATLLPAGAASAHAELISVNPADGATLDQVPASVVLTVGEDIDPTHIRTRLQWPGGAAAVTAGVKGAVVTVPAGSTAQVRALADPNGAYAAVYRVVSKDGHPVSGTVSFTVTGGPTATRLAVPPAAGRTAGKLIASASASASAPAPAPAPSSTGSTLLYVGIGAVVAAGIAGTAIVALRRMRGPNS